MMAKCKAAENRGKTRDSCGKYVDYLLGIPCTGIVCHCNNTVLNTTMTSSHGN